MRPVGALSKTFGLALALAAIVSTASVQAAPRQNQAVVRTVRGTANYSTDAGANWKKLNVGARLNQNSVVRTAPGATVDLFLGVNGPVVRVTEATTMGIDKLTMDATGVETVIETQLDLRNGRILGNVKRLAAASRYEVKTPQGVAGIRGTRYDIRADGTVIVIDGTVVVVYVIDGVAQAPVTVNGGRILTPGQAVMDATPGQIQDSISSMPPIEPPPTPGPTPTVVIVVEPNEAFQQGDLKRPPVETVIQGGTGGE
jgi:hypothetical protein